MRKGRNELAVDPLVTGPPRSSAQRRVSLSGTGQGGWPAGIEFRDLRYFAVVAKVRITSPPTRRAGCGLTGCT
jgi:hypothetical protein